MTIRLNAEQERLIQDAIRSGLVSTPEEALDQALDAWRVRLPSQVAADDSVTAAIRRLAAFGKRHGLSLGDTTVKELLRESRP